MYTKIYCPISKSFISINSKRGKNILQNYGGNNKDQKKDLSKKITQLMKIIPPKDKKFPHYIKMENVLFLELLYLFH